MSIKKKKSAKIARAVVDAVVARGGLGGGPEDDSDHFEDLEDGRDEDTGAKVVDSADEQDDDDEDIWKLDFEAEPSSNKVEKSALRVKTGMPDLTQSDDKRYKGKKASRKSLRSEEEDESDDVDVLDEREHAQAELGHLLEAGSDDDEEEEQDGEDEDSNEEEQEEEEVEQEVDFGAFGGASDDNGTDSDQSDENGEVTGDDDAGQDRLAQDQKKSNKLEKERRKGRQIKRQLEVWDSLLEVRIQLQKIMCKVNQLPQLEQFEAVKNVEAGEMDTVPYKHTLKNAQASVSSALDELMGVKTLLARQTRAGPSGSDDESEPHPSPAKKMKLKEYSVHLAEDFESRLGYRDATIDKWNDKTQLASSGSKQSFAAFELSTLKQISHILSDKSRLVKRTQLKRSNYQIVGKETPPPQEGEEEEGATESGDHDAEIFDDDDFYHQLLRDLIEKKAGAGGGGEGGDLGQKWLQIQKLRSKSKRKVDTRASKGRRIR